MTKRLQTRSTQRREELKVFGLHASLALAQKRRADIIRVYLTPARKREFSEVLSWCAKEKKAYHLVEEEELSKVSGTLHHEGVCILARRKFQPSFAELMEKFSGNNTPGCLIYLDGVENPHNLGAIIRSAAHFGAGGLLFDKKDKLSLSGAAYRVAQGGVEALPVVAIDSPHKVFAHLKNLGFQIIATAPDNSEELSRVVLPKRVIFLLGSESAGVAKDVMKLASKCICIPGSGAVQSLNVSAAAAVFLAEYRRQTI